ncbi:unnamed protein product [Clavelina lepadiformis]|uniref:Uncharacterized protein n=1 Tax=Clavelina lepadiformis TaxID=159417 RepID=A0ABP0H2L5_CLALP
MEVVEVEVDVVVAALEDVVVVVAAAVLPRPRTKARFNNSKERKPSSMTTPTEPVRADVIKTAIFVIVTTNV